MKLADLVDLEWLLREGAPVPDELVRAARPGVLAACAAHGVEAAGARARLAADRKLRVALARAVLDAARRADHGLPGRRVAHALQIAGWLLFLLGALLGIGTAQVVLAYDGRTPINVQYFVFVFFLTQIVLLLVLLWVLCRAGRAPVHDGQAVLHRLLAWFVDRLLGKRGGEVAELLRALRARHALYGNVERWTLFALLQWFGIAFNLAALVTTLLLVFGTDLVFSWSTTLDVTAAEVHGLATWLALPWSWCWPDGVVPLATVEASQWVRMPGAFVGARDLASAQPLAAQWWRFLVAGLVAWGLVPRVLAWAIGTWRRRVALRATGLDHAGFHALFERLLPAASSWAGPDPQSVRGEAPRIVGSGPATSHVPNAPGARAVVFCWGSVGKRLDALRALVGRRFGVEVVALPAIGGASLAVDAAALAEIAVHRPQRALLVFAAGQQPTADALAFVRDLRKALGAARPIVVLLVEARADGTFADATAEEHAIWRRSLGGLGDPYLWIESLAPASPQEAP